MNIAVAQGIIAQARILGGSLGIAASSTILGSVERKQLVETGLISAEQLRTLQASTKFMTLEQLLGVQKGYSDAFVEDMKVCAGVAAVCVLATAIVYRRHPRDVRERIKEQMESDRKRFERAHGGGMDGGVTDGSVSVEEGSAV